VLASLVIKIEYHRALHQDSVGIPRQYTTPSFPPAKKLSISSFSAAFLPGSAQYVEMAVTHSKQTIATFLPGSRIARQPFQSPSKITHLIPLTCPDPGRVSHFLTGSGSQTEIAVTHSKQMSGAFLTGARIVRQPQHRSSETPENPRPLEVCPAVALHENAGRCSRAIPGAQFRRCHPTN
jgi:hypothetical protein